MTETVIERAREADCGHWLIVGARSHEHEGRVLCNLCAAKYATTTAERQAILGVPVVVVPS